MLSKKIYLGRRISKDGSGLTERARVTRRERDYKGSVLTGDSLVAMDTDGPDAEGRGQRKLASQTIEIVAKIARLYRRYHGEPIVMDPKLEAWLVGPATYGDMTTLEHPASRLQLTAMLEIAADTRLY